MPTHRHNPTTHPHIVGLLVDDLVSISFSSLAPIITLLWLVSQQFHFPKMVCSPFNFCYAPDGLQRLITKECFVFNSLVSVVKENYFLKSEGTSVLAFQAEEQHLRNILKPAPGCYDIGTSCTNHN